MICWIVSDIPPHILHLCCSTLPIPPPPEIHWIKINISSDYCCGETRCCLFVQQIFSKMYNLFPVQLSQVNKPLPPYSLSSANRSIPDLGWLALALVKFTLIFISRASKSVFVQRIIIIIIIGALYYYMCIVCYMI